MSEPVEQRDPRELRVWLAVTGAASIAALLIPSGPPGIGLLLVGLAIAGAVAAARPRPLDVESASLGATALLLLAMGTVYDAIWLVFVDVVVAAGCSAIAVTSSRSWASIAGAPFRVAREAMRVPASFAGSFPSRETGVDAGVAARALGVSALLLVTFGALFMSADAAFARIAEDVLLPDIGTETLPARITVGLLVLAGAGGLVLAGRTRAVALGPAASQIWQRAPRRPVSTFEWVVPLALLDVLFAAFVVVQMTVLFGGHRHVLETTGLTYAEYARSGFFQLVTIAVLVLAVIAVTTRATRETPRPRLVKVLLGILCVLTLVVLASALRRMDVYESAYGLTRIRVAVYAVDLWLAGLFVLVMVAGAAGRAPWLPRAVLALSLAALLAFNLSNPEARIAESGVARWQATGEIDAYYLSTLSADAVPSLLEFPAGVRACILDPIVDRTRRATGAWSSFNVARARALDLTAREEPGCSY